jgi:undecaprenyl diphosphate synthase
MKPAAATVPRHIGLVLDGNRRWATARGLPPMQGHRAGYDTLVDIIDAVLGSGVQYVSAYVFSTENWQRASAEVKFLMNLVLSVVTKDLETYHKKGIRIVWLGSKQQVSKKVRATIERAEELTKDNQRGTFGLCFNHGGHREIAEAVQRIVASGVPAGDVDEATIAANLDHPDVPPIDLLIRTSGEQRLSNFMLWRAAYSELVFTDTLWPDFTPEELERILEDYTNRQRRFGR